MVDLETFLAAMLLHPRSVTADFNFRSGILRARLRAGRALLRVRPAREASAPAPSGGEVNWLMRGGC